MINRDKFFGAIRHPLFGGAFNQSQVDGISALLDAIEASGVMDTSWRAYMLATAYHETAHTMQPIEEYGKGRGHSYGAPAGPWHRVYDGRGDVQLTWYENYVHATMELRKLGVIGADTDLARNPELAMRLDIAAAIMIYGMTQGWFTGKKLADFQHPGGYDFVNARTIINGHDRAQLIAGYAQHILAALQAATANGSST